MNHNAPPHWKPVDWPLIAGDATNAPRTLPSGAATPSLVAIADELASYRELDVVLKRSVELAREHLSLERTAIFLYDDDGTKLCGTWGTNLAGATTDEHRLFFQEGFHHRLAKAKALSGESGWLVFEEVPLVSEKNGEPCVVGRGWNAITPILGRTAALGLFCNDSAISELPLDEFKQSQLAILSRILGGLIEDLRRNSVDLPWKPLLSRLPRIGKGDTVSVATSLAQALHGDPETSASELARTHGLTQKRLAFLFQSELGMSVVEYRNRVRIERFFNRVDPTGGNLLQAALDAGFGSYAQFHRVFRQLLGTTPKLHLATIRKSEEDATSDE